MAEVWDFDASIRRGLGMKKTYEKPTLVRRELLVKIAALKPTFSREFGQEED
jgi:hypothetical protein